MLLAAFSMMMLWAGVGYWHSAQPQTTQKIKPGTWAILFGIAAGLAFATKETAILTFAAAAIAALPFAWRKTSHVKARDAVLAFMGFALTSILLYSSFASNWQGVYNAFIAAPLSYIHRAAGSAASQGAAAHVHPWWQYFKWLFDGNEGLFVVIVALPMGLLALLAKDSRPFVPPSYRTTFIFASIYSAALVALYSMIPYKTPWCALQILPGLVLVVTLGALLFIRILHNTYENKLQPHHHGKRIWGKIWCYMVFLAIFGSVLTCNITEVIRLNRDPDSKDIPYNYASASPQVQELASLIIDKLASSQSRGFSYGNTDSPSKIEGVAAGRGSMTGDGIIPPRPFGALPLSQGESSTCHPQLFDITEKSDSLTVGQFDSADTSQSPATNTKLQTLNSFVAVALPPEDTWPLPFYLRSINDKVGYWTQFGELEALAGLGRKPAVVVVPAEEGHLVQPLFPHLKNTKRFEMRPRVRVRAFW